ncbi:hypothetical protein [Kiloniella sp.]|uniref:hypothetical protein n=1 Tax=Kiloniella sp. TaxID=1938587 RepID=UPI003B017287
MLIVIYLLYVKLSETIHINRLLGGRHLFLLNKAEKSQGLLWFLLPSFQQDRAGCCLFQREEGAGKKDLRFVVACVTQQRQVVESQ